MSTTEKCNDSLQKEVEEERNASGVATNEAMSMITRLQEEKATLQMEALQYFRMMEKQPEYDTDELEKVNGLPLAFKGMPFIGGLPLLGNEGFMWILQ